MVSARWRWQAVGPIMIEKRIVRKNEVLKRLGIRKTTLHETFIKTGRLRFVKIGVRRRRYHRGRARRPDRGAASRARSKAMIGRDHSRWRGKVALVLANSAIRATTRAREGSQATHPGHTLSVLLNVLRSRYWTGSKPKNMSCRSINPCDFAIGNYTPNETHMSGSIRQQLLLP